MEQPKSPLDAILQLLVRFEERDLGELVLKAFLKNAARIEELDQLSELAFKLKYYEFAETVLLKMIEIFSQSQDTGTELYSIRSNLINIYNNWNHPEKALYLTEQQEAVVPLDRDRDLKKAYAYFLLTRRDEAEAILRKHLEDPDLPEKTRNEINFNLGTYELYKGQFQQGLGRFLKYGPLFNNWRHESRPYPQLTSKDQIAGKSILIQAEAGIGDEFINIRFTKHIEQLGGKAVWITDRKDLYSIFVNNDYLCLLGKADAEIHQRFDYWCYSMNLPVILDLQPADLWTGPYLKAFKKQRQSTVQLPNSLLKIGLRWEGNPHYEQNLHRSVPFEELYQTVSPYFSNKQSTLISLQRDTGCKELEESSYPIIDGRPWMNTFEDTLSLINELDLVITSCTSIAHASAAMGKMTLVLVPISAYYVWCHPTVETPWYGDNVILFRQTEPRSWEAPLKALSEYLSNYPIPV